jgi:hypothetical protein
MSKYLPATLGIAAMLIASTTLAQARSEVEKSTIKAATDCVAAAALNNSNIDTLYREHRLKEVTNWIVLNSSACDTQLRAMRLLHDRLYGEGTGRRFLLGDYLADLPRAVGERIANTRIVAQEDEDQPSASPGRPLTHGVEMKVVNVGANDVLNIREYATEKSPIIDIIPPNADGVIYLGESQGQWIFVRYDRAKAKGWVNRRFVTPIVPQQSQGGHISN